MGIIQSNYIPWKGYFDIISQVDLFIFHDDVQFTKGDWRNRNRVKRSDGSTWLTIPCGSNQKRLICEVDLLDPSWQLNHWRIIEQSYKRAPYFAEYSPFFRDIYLGQKWGSLSKFNQHTITRIAEDLLGFKTKFRDSREFQLSASKGERVLELLQKAGATAYLSGPSAKSYLDESEFAVRGITLEWADYSRYPTYPQLHPPFDHFVSIIDLLFSAGDDAVKLIRP